MMSENQKKLDRLKKRVGAGIFQQIMDEFSGEKYFPLPVKQMQGIEAFRQIMMQGCPLKTSATSIN